MEQRTPEWYAERLGKVTASRVADVIAKTKTGYSASRANYMAELLCERLTGSVGATYSNAAVATSQTTSITWNINPAPVTTPVTKPLTQLVPLTKA